MEKLLKDEHSNLRQLGAVSLIGMALCYICLFIIYGAMINPPHSGAETIDKITNLLAQKTLIKAGYVGGYVLFSCFLCVCIQVIHKLYGKSSSFLVNTASLFGLFWALVVLCTGLIGITSLETLSAIVNTAPDASEIIYLSSLLMEESLGGGIEILGGLWVFFLGVVGLRHKCFSRLFSAFSVFKGVIGISTVVIVDDILLDLFGLTGIIWFLWFSVIVYSGQKFQDSKATE